MQHGVKGSVMKRFALLFLSMLLGSCHTLPNRLVYSGGFSFANYDYVVVAKPEGKDTATSLYGMDVEFANLMSRFNMKVIGDKEYPSLSPETKQRTLEARMSVSASNKVILFSVSFDDSVTGRTGASISAYGKGNVFDVNARTKVWESASGLIIEALQKDKGLRIQEEPSPVK
jgi:hypothetical protein